MAGTIAGDVKLAVNNLKRSYVPEGIRLFEEDRALRKAYTAMIKAKKEKKKEEVEKQKGRIKQLMSAHNNEVKDMDKALKLYEKFFENLFADMVLIRDILKEQVKIDYELHNQKAPAELVAQFAQSDHQKARKFSQLMVKVNDMSRSLAMAARK